MSLLSEHQEFILQSPVSEEVEKLMCDALLDQNLPIWERFRALSLRSVSGSASRNAFITAINDHSVLLAYNAAHELGRMQDIESIPALGAALHDLSLHPIVRQKAAESLGTFSKKDVVPILKRSLTFDPTQEVRETCEFALTRQYKRFRPDLYAAIAIVPPDSVFSVPELRRILQDEASDIHERHIALFALKKLDTEEAISAIFSSIASKSALMRRGVAFVLRSLKKKKAIEELSHILQDTHEHPLVRLQAVEFFARFGDENSIMLLKEFIKDHDPIVAQCCEVALARLDIIRSLKPFEMEPEIHYPESIYFIQTSAEQEEFLCDLLLDQEEPIGERFRAFSLCQLGGLAPREALIKAMRDASSLLACNAVYSLGLMQDARLIPDLQAVLNDYSLCPIVRHKAAEALGASGLDSCVPILQHSLKRDPSELVRDTCELALSRLEKLKKASPLYSRPFSSPLPAVPTYCCSIRTLREVLLNENKSLYERHAALFSLAQLRYNNDDEVISTIIEALGARSTLLRHWVVYALSTRRSKRAIDARCEILKDTREHAMVRQQAARGLESITDDPDVISLLVKFSLDPELIVSQSCELALKRIEFKRLGEPFEHVIVDTEGRRW